MSTQQYNFKVETKEAGQRRKYGDSYYHFIVTNESEIQYNEHVVKNFCTKFLRPAQCSIAERQKKMDEGKMSPFCAYWTQFTKIDDRTFEYKVTEPSTH